jgi:hypothetical protein
VRAAKNDGDGFHRLVAANVIPQRQLLLQVLVVAWTLEQVRKLVPSPNRKDECVRAGLLGRWKLRIPERKAAFPSVSCGRSWQGRRRPGANCGKPAPRTEKKVETPSTQDSVRRPSFALTSKASVAATPPLLPPVVFPPLTILSDFTYIISLIYAVFRHGDEAVPLLGAVLDVRREGRTLRLPGSPCSPGSDVKSPLECSRGTQTEELLIWRTNEFPFRRPAA